MPVPCSSDVTAHTCHEISKIGASLNDSGLMVILHVEYEV